MSMNFAVVLWERPFTGAFWKKLYFLQPHEPRNVRVQLSKLPASCWTRWAAVPSLWTILAVPMPQGKVTVDAPLNSCCVKSSVICPVSTSGDLQGFSLKAWRWFRHEEPTALSNVGPITSPGLMGPLRTSGRHCLR